MGTSPSGSHIQQGARTQGNWHGGCTHTHSKHYRSPRKSATKWGRQVRTWEPRLTLGVGMDHVAYLQKFPIVPSNTQKTSPTLYSLSGLDIGARTLNQAAWAHHPEPATYLHAWPTSYPCKLQIIKYLYLINMRINWPQMYLEQGLSCRVTSNVSCNYCCHCF